MIALPKPLVFRSRLAEAADNTTSAAAANAADYCDVCTITTATGGGAGSEWRSEYSQALAKLIQQSDGACDNADFSRLANTFYSRGAGGSVSPIKGSALLGLKAIQDRKALSAIQLNSLDSHHTQQLRSSAQEKAAPAKEEQSPLLPSQAAAAPPPSQPNADIELGRVALFCVLAHQTALDVAGEFRNTVMELEKELDAVYNENSVTAAKFEELEKSLADKDLELIEERNTSLAYAAENENLNLDITGLRNQNEKMVSDMRLLKEKWEEESVNFESERDVLRLQYLQIQEEKMALEDEHNSLQHEVEDLKFELEAMKNELKEAENEANAGTQVIKERWQFDQSSVVEVLKTHEEEKRELERQFQEELHNIRRYYEKKINDGGSKRISNADTEDACESETTEEQVDDEEEETDFVSAEGFSDAGYRVEEIYDDVDAKDHTAREENPRYSPVNEEEEEEESGEEEQQENDLERIIMSRVEEQVRLREAEWNDFAVEIEQALLKEQEAVELLHSDMIAMKRREEEMLHLIETCFGPVTPLPCTLEFRGVKYKISSENGAMVVESLANAQKMPLSVFLREAVYTGIRPSTTPALVECFD